MGAVRRALPQPLRGALTRALPLLTGCRLLTWLWVTLDRLTLLTGLLRRAGTGATRRSHHSARRRSLRRRVLRGYALCLARGG
ncbi:hypothetical protein GCM10009745_39680 [Kribbella yunnanensis]|uniref:Secreted protein n=1 Tax=Kribbella yunnanensis TaxID=190194 RepID=A0ABP4TMP8_9ACTN